MPGVDITHDLEIGAAGDRAGAAAGRDPRRPVPQAGRARRRAQRHHRRRRGQLRAVGMGAVAAGRAGRAAVQRERLHLVPGRRPAGARRLHDRQADRDDDGRGHLRLAAGARLHHRLHGRGRRLPALLQLHQPVHVLDADAGDGQQLPAAVLRLGSGGPGVVPADRLLVQAPDRDLRQPQGVPGQPRRRLRLHPRHRRGAVLVRHARLRDRVRQCADHRRRRPCRSSAATSGRWRR